MKRSSRALLLALASALLCLPVLATSAQDRPRTEADVMEGEPEETEDPGDVESDERSEGGEKVKVFRFSGLDVAGRLKSPQLLYFLNRMRAEFDRPRLPHRSFIPELQRSTHGKAFR
jgi:hypothetical protein